MSLQTKSAARWLACCLLVLCCAACGGKTPRLAKLGTNDVILAFGDSLTFGTGAAEHESYPAVLAREVSAQGLERLPEALAEHKPKLAIVCLGGNDMLRQINDAQIAANLRAIVRAVKQSGAQAVLVGVPRPALLTSAPKYYEDIAAELDIPYEGNVVTAVLYKNELKSDPIHPNAAGYRRMAEALAALLRKAGAV